MPPCPTASLLVQRIRFRRWSPALYLAWILALPTQAMAQRANTDAAMRAARDGGVVLLCRHAITARMREVEPVDYDDISTQRLLSDEGERQAQTMGRAFEALGMVPTEVVASPMHRARRTAELMFDRPAVIDSAWHTNGNDFSGPPMHRRAQVLQTPVEGGNRLIVSHIGTMRSALGRSPGEVEEGDCVVVRPKPDGHEIVGVVPWRTWLRAAGTGFYRFLTTRPPVSYALRLLRLIGK